MTSFFAKVVNAFKSAELTPVIVGGWAMNYLGHSRNTLDIDFMILEDDFDNLKEHLENAGLSMVFRNPLLFAKFRDTEEDILELDILFTDKLTYAKLISDATETEHNGLRCFVPSPISMIAMKLHALKNNFSNRLPKDFPDIVALTDLYDINVTGDKFKALCKKYGTDAIYQLILDSKQ